MTSFSVPCTQTCSIEPFKNPVTAQDPVTSDSINLLSEAIEQYLQRFVEAVCADMQCIDEKLNELDERVTALEGP